uniref:DUF834 domain-containing protein n=1 Tax=Oryza nivara TaxID=4536 RepID=A0A0E0J9G1_ORYNI
MGIELRASRRWGSVAARRLMRRRGSAAVDGGGVGGSAAVDGGGVGGSSRMAAVKDGGVNGSAVVDGDGVGRLVASWLTWKGAAWADQRRRDSRGRELSGSGEEREGGGRWIARWDVGAILSVGISPR